MSSTWNAFGTQTTDAHFSTDAIAPTESYKRTYTKKKQSTQACGVGTIIHHTVNGAAPTTESDDINEAYWHVKNTGKSIPIESGVRVYEKESSTAPLLWAEAATVEYTPHDWGLTDPNAKTSSTEQAEVLSTESGALTLVSLGAAFLTTILVI